METDLTTYNIPPPSLLYRARTMKNMRNTTSDYDSLDFEARRDTPIDINITIRKIKP